MSQMHINYVQNIAMHAYVNIKIIYKKFEFYLKLVLKVAPALFEYYLASI